MKKILVSLLISFSSILRAEPTILQKDVLCEEASILLSSITQKFKEIPVWLGENEKGKVILFLNAQNANWTVVQVVEKIACILETGEKFQLRIELLNSTTEKEEKISFSKK